MGPCVKQSSRETCEATLIPWSEEQSGSLAKGTPNTMAGHNITVRWGVDNQNVLPMQHIINEIVSIILYSLWAILVRHRLATTTILTYIDQGHGLT